MASRRRSSSPVESGNVSASKIRSLGPQPVALGGDLVDAVGDLHLPLDVAGLTALVDQQADDGRAVVAGERHDAVEAAARQLAVLEVGRVEDRPAADVLEAGLHHRRLRRVHHERHAGLRWRSAWRSRPCRRRRRARRSRRTRRARGRPRGPARWPSGCTCPSRPASIASRNAFEPLAFVRSPMIRKLRSCSMGTGL